MFKHWCAIIGSVVGALLLVSLHQETNPVVFASFRVGSMLIVILCWRQLVEVLIANDLIHPMRRTAAIDFRWRFLMLVTMLELLVIQQIPVLLMDVLALER